MSTRFSFALLSLVAILPTACSSTATHSRNTAASPWGRPPEGAWIEQLTEPYKGKRDDIHFVDASVGFYGTGAGDLFRSDDGGKSWSKIWSKKGTFIRAIGFIDARTGFIGNVGDYYPGVTDRNPLYRTRDGGFTWAPVDIGGVLVEGICAVDVLKSRRIYQGELRESVLIHAAGRVGGPAKLLRSSDGGESWSYIDLSDKAGMILDVKFLSPETGFVFAGSSSDPARSQALILKTDDAGKTWRQVYRSARGFENIWKGTFVDSRTGYATVQTYDPKREQQVIVKTTNGGVSWQELPLVVNGKARQFGIGFATADVGWVGTAAGGFETRNGGKSWSPAPLAPAANKIRVLAVDGTPMVYAIGTKVQIFSPALPPDGPLSPR